MSSDSPRSKHSKQSVVRSLKHAWSNLTKKGRLDEKNDNPFASTWFLVDEETIDRKRRGCLEPEKPALASSSLDSFTDALSRIPEFPLPPTPEKENRNELISFLPSFESPSSSPRSSCSRESRSFDGNRIYPIPEVDCPEDRSFSLSLVENSSDYSSFFSSDTSSSPTSTASNDSNRRTHRARPASIDVRMVSDFGPVSVHCWRPLSWFDLLSVVSIRTNRPKEEIAFVCKNYPNAISSAEEYDAMLAWLLASTNRPNPTFDIWVVNKTLTSGRMHIGSPRAQSSLESLRTRTPPSPQPNRRLRRAATTLMSPPKVSEAPPLSWKLGMRSAGCPESLSTDSKLCGWI